MNTKWVTVMGKKVRNMEDLKKKFPTATLIKDWDELREWAKTNGESKSHILEVEEYTGHINYKGEEKYNPKKDWGKTSTISQSLFVDSYVVTVRVNISILLECYNRVGLM